MFLILYSNNWPNFIIWLSLLLAILGNMCIANVCFPGRDVIIFEINFILLIKLFYYMTKKSRQKFKYLQKERWKKRGEKKLFHIFKRFSFAKNSPRPESAPFRISFKESCCNETNFFLFSFLFKPYLHLQVFLHFLHFQSGHLVITNTGKDLKISKHRFK